MVHFLIVHRLTTGIGAGMATAFAKYAPKDKNAPYIILIGRSQQGADTVIAEMKKFNSAGQYEFIKGDLSLMKGVRSVADEVAGKVDKINYLCMSQGILSIKTQDDTTEGIDRKASLHFYSRLTPSLAMFYWVDFSWRICCFQRLKKLLRKEKKREWFQSLLPGKGAPST